MPDLITVRGIFSLICSHFGFSNCQTDDSGGIPPDSGECLTADEEAKRGGWEPIQMASAPVACRGDAALQRELATLLAAHEEPGAIWAASASDLASDWLSEQPPAPTLIGRRIGHYQIKSLLGKSCSVYRPCPEIAGLNDT
jgi:hypothetical protein